MGRKRTGSVYEKDGALWYSFQLRSGKRWTKRVPPLPSGKTATREEARAYLEAAVRRYELGLWDPEAPVPETPAPPPVPTVAEYGERWARELTHRSAENEQLFVRLHVEGSELGAMKLGAVEPQHVAAWVRMLLAKPSSKGGTLAPLTVRGFVKYLTRLFAGAVFERLITATPCVLPKGLLPAARDKVPGARRAWKQTRDEIIALISDVRVPEARRALWALLFFTGDRAGEAFALRWLDLERRAPLDCLHVSRAWSRRHREYKEPKTGAVREVPVHPTLAAILAEWKLSGWERAYGRRPTPEDLIVPSARMRARDSGAVWKMLTTDCATLEISRRRLHGLRHAFISLSIDDGADRDILRKITHTKPARDAFDGYAAESWDTLCREVSKLKVSRRPDELPLFKIASSGGGPIGQSATDSATPQSTTKGNAMSEDDSARVQSLRGDDRRFRRDSQFTDDLPFPAESSGPIPERIATSSTDSATDSATTGPLTGELWAEDWFERSLLAELAGGGES